MGCVQKEPTWVVVHVGWGAANVVVLVEYVVVVDHVEVDDVVEVFVGIEEVGGVDSVEEMVDEGIIEELSLLTCVLEASLYQFA